MPTDIRLDVGVLDHPKTVKLEKRLGIGSFKCLLRLWMFCRAKRPKGILTGMTKEDVEIAAQWNGEPEAFVSSLLEIGWLDDQDGTYIIHDWGDHQPWAVGSEERSRIGRENAKKGWEKRKKPVNPQPKDNGICSYRNCQSPASIVVMGKAYCSKPDHRKGMFDNVLK